MTPGRLGAWLRGAIIALLVLVLLSCPVWGGDAARSFLILFAYSAAFAQMWNLLAGYAGLVTFGQQVFIGLGSYTLAVGCERLGLGVAVSFALAAVVAGTLAVPIGALTFRLRGGYFAVGTWLVAEVFRLLFGNWKFVDYASGMFIRPARTLDPWLVFYVAVGLLIAIIALVVMTLRSRVGLALMAIRDAEDSAAGLGVHVWRLKLLVFVVAAAGTGLIAALMAIHTLFIRPDTQFSISWSAEASFMAVVGGLGTVEGPLIGAVIFALLQQYFDTAIYLVLGRAVSDSGALRLIVLGAISVIVMLVAPRGIAGLLRDHLGWTLFPVARKPPRGAITAEDAARSEASSGRPAAS